jgi:hypothetical protein
MQLDGYAVYFEDEGEVFATGYDLPVPAVGDEVDIARTSMVVRKIVWRIEDALPLEKYNRGRLTVHVVLGNHAKCRALLTNADVQHAKEKHRHPDATAYFSFEES